MSSHLSMYKYDFFKNESDIYFKDQKVLCYRWVSSEILFSNGNIPDIESKIRGIFFTKKRGLFQPEVSRSEEIGKSVGFPEVLISDFLDFLHVLFPQRRKGRP